MLRVIEPDGERRASERLRIVRPSYDEQAFLALSFFHIRTVSNLRARLRCISPRQNPQKNRTNFRIRPWGFLSGPSAVYMHVSCGNSRLRTRECVHDAQGGGRSSPLSYGHP